MLLCLLPCHVLAVSSVTVYGTGTYTNTDFDLNIYGNISECNLLSFGVKLSYNPADLTVNTAIKNENVWYFGDETTKYPYMDPNSSGDGSVIIIGGKLDINNPTSGVVGNDILLGNVSFTRNNSNPPTISLGLGRDGKYKNFVTTEKMILDDQIAGVDFEPIVVVPRDSDNDGLSDIDENNLGTDVNDDDSDDDGHNDGDEVAAGSNPLDESSSPATTVVQLRKGFNLVGIPADPKYQSNLKDWLQEWGNSFEIEKVLAFNEQTGRFLTMIPGDPENQDYTLSNGEAVFIYANQEKEITFNSVLCPSYNLSQGTNIIGVACPPNGYSAYDLLNNLGPDIILSIQRFDLGSGSFETAGYENDVIVGVDFPIIRGEGYLINIKENAVFEPTP